MCPPGVDQTERSPQSWCMMVPGLRQKYGVNFMADARQRFSTNEVDCWAWSRLARLDPDVLNRLDSTLRLNPHPQPSSPLMNLPFEIILNILAHLDKPAVLSLASSCLLSTYRLISHIDQHIITGSAPWANEPLACLGTYLRTLPPAFEQDKFALRSVGLEYLTEPEHQFPPYREYYGNLTCVARKYNWAAIRQYVGPQRRFSWVHDKEEVKCDSELQSWLSMLSYVERMDTRPDSPPEITTRVLRQILSPQRLYGVATPSQSPSSEERPGLSRQVHRLIDGLRKRKAHMLDDNTDRHSFGGIPKPHSLWYLRNLDTKEFVRIVPQEVRVSHKKDGQSLNQSRESVQNTCKSSPEPVFKLCCPEEGEQRTYIAAAVMHEGSEIIPVEAVIALRTFWPDATSTRFQHDTITSLVKQQMPTWAGHRFDMVTESMHHRTACATTSPGVQGGIAGSGTLEAGAAAHETANAKNQACDRSGDDEQGSTQNVKWRDVTDENVRIVQQCFRRSDREEAIFTGPRRDDLRYRSRKYCGW